MKNEGLNVKIPSNTPYTLFKKTLNQTSIASAVYIRPCRFRNWEKLIWYKTAGGISDWDSHQSEWFVNSGLILSDLPPEMGQICECLLSKKEAYGAPHLLQLITERKESHSWCPGAASSLFTHSIIHSGCNWHLRSAPCPAASLPSRHLSCLINCQGSCWNYSKVCFFFWWIMPQLLSVWKRKPCFPPSLSCDLFFSAGQSKPKKKGKKTPSCPITWNTDLHPNINFFSGIKECNFT